MLDQQPIARVNCLDDETATALARKARYPILGVPHAKLTSACE
jgi:hypothetical protein